MSRPSPPTPEAALTRWTGDARKSVLYRDDINFLETALQLGELGTENAHVLIDRATAIVFKPDAFVSRSMGPAIVFLIDHGFVPLRCEFFTYDRNMIRAAWRYQINIATCERLRVVEHLLAGRSAAYLLLGREAREGAGSASEALNALKGEAEIAGRTPDCLRSLLGDHNTFLNKVHIPDDTADFLRELSVYFDHATRSSLLRHALAQGPVLEDSTGLADTIQASWDRHSFDVNEAIGAMRGEVARAPIPQGERRKLLIRLAALSEGAKLSHSDIDLFLDNVALFRDWDLVVLLTQCVEANRPRAKKIL